MAAVEVLAEEVGAGNPASAFKELMVTLSYYLRHGLSHRRKCGVSGKLSQLV